MLSTHGARHMGAMCPEWTMGTVHPDAPGAGRLCCQAVRFMFCSEPARLQPPCPTFTRETAVLQAMFPTIGLFFQCPRNMSKMLQGISGFLRLFLCFVLLLCDCECLGTGDGWVERPGAGDQHRHPHARGPLD